MLIQMMLFVLNLMGRAANKKYSRLKGRIKKRI